MRSNRFVSVMSVATVLLMVLAAFSAVPVIASPDTGDRVLVTFKDKIDKDLIKKEGGTIETELDLIPGVITTLKSSSIKELKKNSAVKSITKDSTFNVIQAKGGNPGRPEKPGKGDSGESLVWGVDKIDAEKVWDTTTGSAIKVAVIDTGIDSDHEDLDVAGGTSTLNGITSWEDDHGHGTHCAGIIAAQHNGKGVKGVAPGVELYAVKAVYSNGNAPFVDVLEAMDWAVYTADGGAGVDVISMSLGWESSWLSDAQKLTFEEACDAVVASGVVMVVAAGNSGSRNANLDNILYPARFPSVIAVGAVASNNRRAQWSSTGDTLDIVAPGVRIESTYYDGGYTQMSGTSMACPHVAGTVALMLTQTPSGGGEWTVDKVKSDLSTTADDLGTTGLDNAFGWGLVDAEEAALGSVS